MWSKEDLINLFAVCECSFERFKRVIDIIEEKTKKVEEPVKKSKPMSKEV